jgi:integrase
MVGRRADGTPDTRSVFARTQRACLKKLRELRERHDRGLVGDARVEQGTVEALLRRWLEGRRGTIDAASWRRHRNNVENHLSPAVGRLKAGALRADDLRRLYARLSATGLAPRTVRYVHTTVSQALDQAVRDGDLPRSVAANVSPPKLERKEMRPLTPEEVVRLRAGAAGYRLASLWVLAGQVGCREGELLGLKWADVDWDRATVTIQRTLVRVRDGVPEFGDPKTEAGRRTLPLPRTALAALRGHRDRQEFERRRLGDDYTDLDLVFASHTGTPLLARNVVRAFKALLARAGLPRTVRVHDLRHTAATALLASGTDLATTARVLGHASPQVTATVYAHVLPRATAEAMARLEDVYARAERAARG